eukprot:TRINITY_DN12753_c0_g1_i1.p1 TRINITY_DN12753_c0_g1~~TRINITY_DN12753_c0_g1_i1.p1  ORF type:complete len:159 (-),score=51.57 TRINITY_DN12753_c0_g1_i1:324-800(-)
MRSLFLALLLVGLAVSSVSASSRRTLLEVQGGNDMSDHGIILIVLTCFLFVVLCILIGVIVWLIIKGGSGFGGGGGGGGKSYYGGDDEEKNEASYRDKDFRTQRADVSAKTKVEFPDTEMNLQQEHGEEAEAPAKKGRQQINVSSTSSSFMDYRNLQA